VRELSILAIARGNQYAWSHHHPHAIKAGLTQQELDALEANEFAPTLSAIEKAAVAYVREFAQGGRVADETFAEARRHFTERQVTELTLLAGYFMVLGATVNAFKVGLEPQFPPKAKLEADHL
jgi:alkylhydroperoxidase family enzyme